jgi:Mg/Co/Ni transporter MgtE
VEPGRWQDTVEELRSEPDLAQLANVAQRLDPADLAAVLAELDEDRRRLVFTCLGDEAAAQALDEADPAIKTGLVLGMAIERAAVILEAMPADEAADLLGALPGPRARAILSAMEPAGASQVQRLLSYPVFRCRLRSRQPLTGFEGYRRRRRQFMICTWWTAKIIWSGL